MKTINVRKITIPENTNIKNAIRIIDRLGLRTVYVVNKRGKLLGIVTDSEVRKAILKGIDIKETVEKIINPNPIFLTEKDLENSFATERVLKKLLKKMPDATHSLVVDKYNIPQKVLLVGDLLGRSGTISKIKSRRPNFVKSVLVAGGAGYLGSVLVEKLLLQGYKVKVLDLFLFGSDHMKNFSKHKRLEMIEGDIRNISTIVDCLVGVDAVINLASIVGDPASKNDPEGTIETNYLANKVLAEACKYFQINRFIFASTCSVYGFGQNNNELSEDSNLNPLSLYARSKIRSEEAILSLEDENFSPTILRMGTLCGYSPRMRFDLVVNAMIKSALMNNKIIVYGGKQYRPLLDINDAADAYIKCLESSLTKIKGQIFNVGSNDQNYKIIEVAEAVKKYVPGSSIVINKSKDDNRDYIVSFKKISKDLKFKTRHKLSDSIKVIIRAIKAGKIKDVNDSKYYNS